MGRLVQGDDFSKSIVLSLLFFLFAFVVVVLVIFVVKGYEPSSLIHSVFVFIGVEFWILGRMKKAKIDKEKAESVAKVSGNGIEMSKEFIRQEGQRWNL